MRKDACVFAVMILLLAAPPASSDPVFGFNEPFAGTSVGGWSGGIAEFNNPGTGGIGGAGDGYLFGRTISSARWGLRCRSCPEYSGDWIAAGITHIGVSLNDVGTDDPFEVHVAIGNDTNFWQYDVGFDPPHQAWERFVVDLTNAGAWTQIIGSGSLAAALTNVTILLIRHDLPPFMQIPDTITGDLGIDQITLGDLVTPARTTSWGRLKALYAR